MKLSGTYISYYFYCNRRLWLHAKDIRMEGNSQDVEIGKLVEETSYLQRAKKYQQIEIGKCKVDFYDAVNKIIHETKKSSKFHETHIWQMKYYIYTFEQIGVMGVRGIIEYPVERKTEEVYLKQPDRERIYELEDEIESLLSNNSCPSVINNPRCKNCSYNDFCYVGEIRE